MAIARSWGSARHAEGPQRIRFEDIESLNHVFSESFTERYRRDGMVGLRVPFLNPTVWRYAIEDAGDGAMLWRDARGEIVAFNVAHRSGIEGWMGPLAVRPDHQAGGIGKDVVRAGIAWLQRRDTRVIGLETMPRTMDNIGFYSNLGFAPGRLTITLTLDGVRTTRPAVLLGRLPDAEHEDALEECAALLGRLRTGYDFRREIELSERLSLGDTVLLRDGGRLVGFALCHTAPLVEGRAREELRVLKLVLERPADVEPMVQALGDFARRSGTRRVAVRIQGEYGGMYRRVIALGGRVRWTDLRMTLIGYPEQEGGDGIVLSNWEI